MREKLLNKLRLWVPVSAWALIIFLLSSVALPSTSDFYWKDFIFKKGAHIFFYAVLAILIFRGLIGEGVNKKKALIWSFTLAVLYGITDEFHQSFTSGREPRVRDVLFDGFGAFISLTALNRYGFKYEKLLKRFGLY